jgi:hypothetical protein
VIDVDQCPSCNRVWVSDSALPDGGVWKEESEQIDGANRDYCSDCLAKRQAEVASLSDDIVEVVEHRQAEPAAPVVYEEAAPGAWRRPVIIAGVVVIVIAGAVAAQMLLNPVTEEIAVSEEDEAAIVSGGTRPSVSGSWKAGQTRPQPSRSTVRPVSRRPGRQVPSGEMDPEVRRILEEASAQGTPARGTTTRPASSSPSTPSRSTTTGSPGSSNEGGTSETGSSTSTPAATDTETPVDGGEAVDGATEEPVEEGVPEFIFNPNDLPPADGEIPFIPRPDDIGIPFPPPE